MGLLSELKRRNVLRMAALYLVAAWLIVQVADVVIDMAGLPGWLGQATLAVLAVGFPITLLISWFFELTPEGLIRDDRAHGGEAGGTVAGRRLDFIVIALLAAAVIVFAIDKWWGTGVQAPRSIAVLPFRNLSGDPLQEYFSDGISEELLHRLAQVSELHVAARTSAFYFKDTDLPIAEIARQLGVRSVLEGSVRKSGDRLRITAQLIDASNGFHIWSKSYEREVGDIFRIQDEISARIVQALKIELVGEEPARISRQPTADLDAYEAYLRGRQHMARRTSAALQEAAAQFSRAIELDPGFAQANAALAQTYMYLGRYGTLSREEILERAAPLVDRALEIDEQLAEGWSSLGTLRSLQRDYPGAEAAFQRAMTLNPGYAQAYLDYGTLLKWALGRTAEALDLHRTALSLDPLSTPINMAVVEDLHELGRFDEALARCQRVIEIDPDYPRAYTVMADLYWEVYGRLDEGVKWLGKAMELDPGNPDHARWLGMIYLDLGDRDAGAYWIGETLRLAPAQENSMWAALYLARYEQDDDRIVAAANRLLEVSPGAWLALLVLRDADLRGGRPQAALARYRAAVPDLLDAEEPAVDAGNWWWAIEAGSVLLENGEQDRGRRLLASALEVMSALPRLGYNGYGIDDAAARALLGEQARALELLALAVEQGWRSSWWVKTEANRNLASLHELPAYRAIVAGIEQDMQAQLARVNAWKDEGLLQAPERAH